MLLEATETTPATSLKWESYRNHRIAFRPSDGKHVVRLAGQRTIIGESSDRQAAMMLVDGIIEDLIKNHGHFEAACHLTRGVLREAA